MTRDDRGSITLLTIGLVGITAALLVTVVDVSAVYLDRRDLAGECDSAALAAAQATDPALLYAGDLGSTLPVTGAASGSAASLVARQLGAGTRTTVRVDAGTVTVRCTRTVTVPVGAALGIGSLTVSASSTATSPVR